MSATSNDDKRASGENPYKLYDGLNRLANTVEYAGRLDEAEALFEEALGVLRSAEMGDSRLSRFSKLGLVNVTAARGEFQQAIEGYKKLAERERAGFDDVTLFLLNLAVVYGTIGECDNAEDYARQVID